MGDLVFLFSVVSCCFCPHDPAAGCDPADYPGRRLFRFVDDFQKSARRHSLGLKARHKLAGQFIFALLFYIFF